MIDENENPVPRNRNQIDLKNPQSECRDEEHCELRATYGDEERAEEVTAANQGLDAAFGSDVKEGQTATRLEQVAGPEHSVDEHMPAGSESAEDKAIDVINSGILRI